MTTKLKRAVIYVRLSSYRGAEDASTSPERQRDVCTAYATAKGWTVVDVIEDLDVSGSARGDRLDRPGLRRIRELYSSINVVIFAKLDRLARNTRDFAAIAEEAAENGVALASVAESLDLTTPSGRFVATILAAFAEMEAETIAERTAAGRAEARRQGRFTGGTPPFGTRAVDRPGGGRVLEVDTGEAAILRTLVSKYLFGVGTPALARWLNGEGVPTTRGGPWRASVVRRVLYDHARESIVLTAPERRALADAVRERSLPERTPPKDNATALLTGVLRCSRCGSPLHRDSEGRRQRPVYRCSSEIGEPRRLHARVIAEEADALVAKAFLDDWGEYRPGVRVVPGEQYDLDVAAATDAVEALKADLTAADRQGRAEILERLNAAEDALEALLDSPPPRVLTYRAGTVSVGEQWDRGNTRDRRDLLRSWLGAVMCHPARDDDGRIRSTAERLVIPRMDDPDPELTRDSGPRSSEVPFDKGKRGRYHKYR